MSFIPDWCRPAYIGCKRRVKRFLNRAGYDYHSPRTCCYDCYYFKPAFSSIGIRGCICAWSDSWKKICGEDFIRDHNTEGSEYFERSEHFQNGELIALEEITKKSAYPQNFDTLVQTKITSNYQDFVKTNLVGMEDVENKLGEEVKIENDRDVCTNIVKILSVSETYMKTRNIDLHNKGIEENINSLYNEKKSDDDTEEPCCLSNGLCEFWSYICYYKWIRSCFASCCPNLLLCFLAGDEYKKLYKKKWTATNGWVYFNLFAIDNVPKAALYSLLYCIILVMISLNLFIPDFKWSNILSNETCFIWLLALSHWFLLVVRPWSPYVFFGSWNCIVTIGLSAYVNLFFTKYSNIIPSLVMVVGMACIAYSVRSMAAKLLFFAVMSKSIIEQILFHKYAMIFNPYYFAFINLIFLMIANPYIMHQYAYNMDHINAYHSLMSQKKKPVHQPNNDDIDDEFYHVKVENYSQSELTQKYAISYQMPFIMPDTYNKMIWSLSKKIIGMINILISRHNFLVDELHKNMEELKENGRNQKQNEQLNDPPTIESPTNQEKTPLVNDQMVHGQFPPQQQQQQNMTYQQNRTEAETMVNQHIVINSGYITDFTKEGNDEVLQNLIYDSNTGMLLDTHIRARNIKVYMLYVLKILAILKAYFNRIESKIEYYNNATKSPFFTLRVTHSTAVKFNILLFLFFASQLGIFATFSLTTPRGILIPTTQYADSSNDILIDHTRLYNCEDSILQVGNSSYQLYSGAVLKCYPQDSKNCIVNVYPVSDVQKMKIRHCNSENGCDDLNCAYYFNQNFKDSTSNDSCQSPQQYTLQQVQIQVNETSYITQPMCVYQSFDDYQTFIIIFASLSIFVVLCTYCQSLKKKTHQSSYNRVASS